jgi:hypothetical protein
MTGFFVRIQRDDKWQSIELDQLTDAELCKFFHDSDMSPVQWAIALAKWIRNNVQVQP